MTLLCRSVLFGPVKGVYSYDPIIPWDATRTLCLLGGGGGGFHIQHHIGEKVPSII